MIKGRAPGSLQVGSSADRTPQFPWGACVLPASPSVLVQRLPWALWLEEEPAPGSCQAFSELPLAPGHPDPSLPESANHAQGPRPVLSRGPEGPTAKRSNSAGGRGSARGAGGSIRLRHIFPQAPAVCQARCQDLELRLPPWGLPTWPHSTDEKTEAQEGDGQRPSTHSRWFNVGQTATEVAATSHTVASPKGISGGVGAALPRTMSPSSVLGPGERQGRRTLIHRDRGPSSAPAATVPRCRGAGA